MADLGENYEYLRVIVENQIQLKKLDLLEDGSKFAGLVMLAIIMFVFIFLMIIALSVIAVLLLTSALESTILALLAFSGIILFISSIFIIFRKQLIILPTIKIFYSLIKNKI